MTVDAAWLVRRLVHEGMDPTAAAELAAGGDVAGALAKHVLGTTSGSGGSGTWRSEHPAGTIDAVNETFTTSVAFVAGTTRLFLNGMRQSNPDSYTESGTNQLNLSFAPHPGDDLTVEYVQA